MNEITVANFRCFREPQSARLAPLTLIVGDNSTGKTSFLALIRALWDVACRERVPDFKEAPYDLGSFEEIVHHGSDRPSSTFGASFRVDHPVAVPSRTTRKQRPNSLKFTAAFEQHGSAPYPTVRRIENSEYWLQADTRSSDGPLFRFGTATDEWQAPEDLSMFIRDAEGPDLTPLSFLLTFSLYQPREVDPPPQKSSWDALQTLSDGFRTLSSTVFATAPVRSQPRRSYDPARPTRDSEGQYIPMYLAHLCRSDSGKWKRLKNSIERFGRHAGLFEEIYVKQLGRGHGDPFQIHVRRCGTKSGPESFHNLVDLGYGVSQVLPIVTEVLRPTASRMFLIQQPEVHLHPSAQAALGSFFCDVASKGRQLIVETHSDHLIDRVRMDIRDKSTKLRAEDVSLLYFERRDREVQIHSLRFDPEGNVIGAPDDYRRFFMEETHRSVGLA